MRAWPPSYPAPEQLSAIHELMRIARESGVGFVPMVLTTHENSTWVAGADRLWEVTSWMPGRAENCYHPSRIRVQAACSALARVHVAWERFSPQTGACPAIQRRLAAVRHWRQWTQTGWNPQQATSQTESLRNWINRAWLILQKWIPWIPHALVPWLPEEFPLQPCLCDIRADHILFSRDEITGLVDFGSIKIDHVAVDLARLLGTMVGDDVEARMAGIDAYSQIRPFSSKHVPLVQALDETGTILGAANWLMWRYRDGRTFSNSEEAVRCFGALVERMEKWENIKFKT